MSSVYKRLTATDIGKTRNNLYESIPIDGQILYGFYVDGGSSPEPDPENVKKFSHGMFQDVYDYPYLQSSANKLFSLTAGLSSDHGLGTINVQSSKKLNIYSQLAQTHVGYDENGNILDFDQDGDFSSGGYKIKTPIFLKFSRLLVKDEIRKETFSMEIDITAASAAGTDTIVITDTGANDNYRTNSPAGEYGILYGVSSTDTNFEEADNVPVGLIYYQTGLVVLDSNILLTGTGYDGTSNFEPFNNGGDTVLTHVDEGTGDTISVGFVDYTIDNIADSIRERISDISFNNTTELNSTVFFCRVGNTEFNYSSNPTYTSNSKIRVKRVSSDEPKSYITTVGLYSSDNELLAVAKLSEPLKKDPSIEQILKVRLDY